MASGLTAHGVSLGQVAGRSPAAAIQAASVPRTPLSNCTYAQTQAETDHQSYLSLQLLSSRLQQNKVSHSHLHVVHLADTFMTLDSLQTIADAPVTATAV